MPIRTLFHIAIPCISFVLGMLLILHRAPQAAQDIEPTGAMQALDLWTRARAYPQSDIAPDKIFRAFRAEQIRKRSTRQTLSPPGDIWQSIGPSNLSGRMISIAINPLNGNTIYAGSASGGLWKSTTAGLGTGWSRVATGYPVLGVAAIAIDPTDTNVIYLGTGEVYRYQGALGGVALRTTRGSYGIGILKSTDDGASWAPSLDWTMNQERGVQVLRIDPVHHTTLWAGTTEGVLKSTDAGATWTVVSPAVMGEDIVINSANPDLVLASYGNLGPPSGIRKTTDGGTSWTEVGPAPFTGKTLLEISGESPYTVFASVADSTSGATGLWKTTDFGTNWTLINNSSISGVQGWYSHFVAVHPQDDNKIVHAGIGIDHSTNGGATFSGSSGSYADHHAFAHHPSNPDILYIVNDDGVYRSTNFGTTFVHASNNLVTGQFYNGFSNSTSDAGFAIGQAQDHIPGYVYQGTASWTRGALDECGWTAVHPANDHIVYAVNRNAGFVGRSTDRGLSSTDVANLPGDGSWNSPIIICPSNPNVLYVGKGPVYKTTDGGSSWSSTSTGAVVDGNLSLSMAVSFTSPDTVYVGKAPASTRTHLFRTTDGGNSWTDITGITPDRYPMDLAVDPRDSRIVYAAFGGANAGHIFRSTDAGTSWNDITGTLPDVPATAVVVDPRNSDYVYAGNDLGVFMTSDRGASWVPFSDGFTDAVLIADLTISPANRKIRAVTHGNGVYERRLPITVPPFVVHSPNGGERWPAGTTDTITWENVYALPVRLQYSTDNGAHWITIADSLPDGDTSYVWEVPFPPSPDALVRVLAVFDSTLADQSDSTFTINVLGPSAASTRWCMVSVPVVVADPSPTNLFPNARSAVFTYEASAYAVKETLLNGIGYWVKLDTGAPRQIDGDLLLADTIPVSEGWNLVGALSAPLPAGLISSDPPGLITSRFWGYSNGYETEDTIEPGSGYWVKVNQPGHLIFSSPGSPGSRSAIRIIAGTEMPPSPPGGTAGEAGSPRAFSLAQNYPNPFNPRTHLQFTIAELDFVTLNVYDVLGRKVAGLVNEVKQPGAYSVEWDASNQPSGVYFYRLQAGSFVETRRLVLVR